MELKDPKTVLTTRPFTVEQFHLKLDEHVIAQPYYRLVCPDWVNVLPVTSKGQAILIRQPRAGAAKVILETPGGVIDAHEKDPTMAAMRELEEETGFTTQRILPLGSPYANPAIQTNRVHLFVALGCYVNPERQHFPDPDERIEVVAVDVAELDTLVRTGQVDHAYSALCIMLAGKYLTKKPG